jgi:hypothetical protein
VNDAEIDLCDADGREFINSCWDVGPAEALTREKRSMAFGADRWPSAAGRLVYHEYQQQGLGEIPNAIPAWKALLGLF